MDEASLNSRLSRISTVWRLLADAQGSRQTQVHDAHLALFERYQGAVYRYLLGASRNADVADDLFQEFALRCLQGAFQRADPQRGRFRDYLKTTLYHLIVDHQRRRQRAGQQLETTVVQPEAAAWNPQQSDRQFLESWREELLARAWAGLRRAECDGGPPHYSVLKFRAENPKVCSTEMAARLNQQLRPEHPFTDANVRKTLQRARQRFAQLLVDDVAQSLDWPTRNELEQELADLELLDYCRSELARRPS